VGPAAVTGETFVEFGMDVADHSLVRDPGGINRDTCTLWNRAVRTIPGWPPHEVPIPDRRRHFALDLNDFPASFRVQVESFLSAGADPDVFSDSYCKPASELTLRNRKRGILMAATALARSGVSVDQITGLNVLVEVKHVKASLRFLYSRAGDKTTAQIYQIANLLKTIARHYLR
jgi:hypothetical protein